MCLLYGCAEYGLVFFFFKQKTAYEIRISDCSSDVCSSDLRGADDGVDHRIEKARGVLLPRFLVGIDQAEVLEAKVSAVGDFVTIVVEIGRASCRARVCRYV